MIYLSVRLGSEVPQKNAGGPRRQATQSRYYFHDTL